MFFAKEEKEAQQQLTGLQWDEPALGFSIVVYRELFFTTDAFVSLVKCFSYSNRYCEVFVYDNTDLDDWKVDYRDHYSNIIIHYHSDQSNPGISKAYNFLALAAKNIGIEWMVFLDQDTCLPEAAVAEYTRAIKKSPEILIKAPVLLVNNKVFSPFRVVFTRSAKIKNLVPGPLPLQNIEVINSGLLVNLALFFEVGGYNECVKLDFADFLFLDRVKKQTDTIEILNFNCEHDFSHNETDKAKVLKRYSLYIIDLINCPKPSVKSKVEYFMLGLLHTGKLTLKFRSIIFFKTWITKSFV